MIKAIKAGRNKYADQCADVNADLITYCSDTYKFHHKSACYGHVKNKGTKRASSGKNKHLYSPFH